MLVEVPPILTALGVPSREFAWKRGDYDAGLTWSVDFTSLTPSTLRAIATALSASAFDLTMPESVTSPLLVSTSMRRPPTSGSLKRRLHLRGNAGVIDRLADRLAAGGDEHAEGDHESERENDRAIGATSMHQLPPETSGAS